MAVLVRESILASSRLRMDVALATLLVGFLEISTSQLAVPKRLTFVFLLVTLLWGPPIIWDTPLRFD